MVGYLAFGRTYLLAVNLTESLPGVIFVVEKGSMPAKGEFVAFRWEKDWPYPKGSIFFKVLHGLPGSMVTKSDLDFFVDGASVGSAKVRSRSGISLIVGPHGRIPPNQYFVAGEHPDSLDSRYQMVGWIRRDQIIGRGYRLL